MAVGIGDRLEIRLPTVGLSIKDVGKRHVKAVLSERGRRKGGGGRNERDDSYQRTSGIISLETGICLIREGEITFGGFIATCEEVS